MPKASIVISSFNRLPLFRRTIHNIARYKPSIPFELIVVDDNSTDDILGELKLYSSQFPWKFIRFDHSQFEAKTGIKKFFNNSSVTMNIGFRHAQGELVFQQGNEIIASEGLYDKLIADSPQDGRPFVTMSETYDVPEQYLELLDDYGENLTPAIIRELVQWPLQSIHYQSLCVNYVSLTSMSVIQSLQGFNEQYMCGISAEDSDFVRRARTLPDFKLTFSKGLSFHQWHGGKTIHRNPLPSVITQERFNEGCKINRATYDDWDGTHKNPQSWPWGEYGIQEIITNG